jgi:hypothetical protein
MVYTSLSIKEETLGLLVRAKAKFEMEKRKTITWDDFLEGLANYYFKKISNEDLEAFM